MSASDGKAATNSARPPRPPGSHSPRSLSPRSTSPRAGGKLSRADSGRLEGAHNPLYSGSDEEGSVQRSFFVRRPSVQLQQPIGNAAIAVAAAATAEPDENVQRQQQAPSGAAAGGGETSVDVQAKAADDDFVEHPQTVTFSDEPPPRRKVVQQHDEAEVYKHMGPAQKCWYLITKMRHPIKSCRPYWDVAVVAVLLYCLVEIPYRVCFESDVAPWSFGDVFNLAVDFFFLVDCYVNFRTGVFIKGQVVMEPKTVARTYLKSWFLIDFLTSIPYTNVAVLFIEDDTSGDAELALRIPRLLRLLRMARLLKLLRLFKLVRVMNKWSDSSGALSDSLQLLKFVLIIFIMSHVCGCVWMLIEIMERDDSGTYLSDSWVARNDVTDASEGRLYLMCLYWSLMTLTTVGYGDVTPRTDVEMAWTCIVMFVGTCTFGYIIGNVTSVITHENAASALIKQRSAAINEYMRARKLPDHLVAAIRQHFDFQWKSHTVFNDEDILGELPTCIRRDVNMYLHRDLIKAVPFLRDSPADCVSELVMRLRPLQLGDGVYLCHKGDVGVEMWFISVGYVDVVDESLDEDHDVIVTLGKGQFMGEFALLAADGRPERRSSSLRTRNYAELFALTRNDFLDVVELMPELYSRIVETAMVKLQATAGFRASDSYQRAADMVNRAHRRETTAAEGARFTDTGSAGGYSDAGSDAVPEMFGDMADGGNDQPDTTTGDAVATTVATATAAGDAPVVGGVAEAPHRTSQAGAGVGAGAGAVSIGTGSSMQQRSFRSMPSATSVAFQLQRASSRGRADSALTADAGGGVEGIDTAGSQPSWAQSPRTRSPRAGGRRRRSSAVSVGNILGNAAVITTLRQILEQQAALAEAVRALRDERS